MPKEKQFDLRFTRAVNAFKEAFGSCKDDGARFVIVAVAPTDGGDKDNIMLCGSGCAHESLDVLAIAGGALSQLAAAENDPQRN